MRAVDNVFHLKCFLCVVCGIRLQKGDQYVIKQSQLFCRPDYEKEVEMFQGYPYGELFSLARIESHCDAEILCIADDYCCEDVFHTRIDGRRGPKRPRWVVCETMLEKSLKLKIHSIFAQCRTILTTQQRRVFKASFDISPKPCRKVREGLAKDTGLSIRIVQVRANELCCILHCCRMLNMMTRFCWLVNNMRERERLFEAFPAKCSDYVTFDWACSLSLCWLLEKSNIKCARGHLAVLVMSMLLLFWSCIFLVWWTFHSFSTGLVPKSTCQSQKDSEEANERGNKAERGVARGLGERSQ